MIKCARGVPVGGVGCRNGVIRDCSTDIIGGEHVFVASTTLGASTLLALAASPSQLQAQDATLAADQVAATAAASNSEPGDYSI